MGERLERLWPSLVALVGVVAVVLVLLWQFGDDTSDSPSDDAAASGDAGGDDEAAEPPPTQPPTDTPTDEPTGDPTNEPTEGETAPEELREPIGVLNQTGVTGLAEFAQQRFEEGGWEVPAIGSWDGSVPETTVYYPEDQQEVAEALMAQFPEIGRIMPTFEGINQERVIVILVDDYVDEVGEPE
ncbi:LytR C-terminal domain-containing protein [Jiangella asiatica]|uniref:LytR family transcriptional regulator n=1 Tax=Jiangella asiatica TaxID=2530372 RepID=A0A4R5DI16_9ACTN|nr:LytR C-terminal domain-containing protein [Jiangella asiatica]TDE10395.1 LytR family transcriptional regulator [Jiangella asiatica]